MHDLYYHLIGLASRVHDQLPSPSGLGIQLGFILYTHTSKEVHICPCGHALYILSMACKLKLNLSRTYISLRILTYMGIEHEIFPFNDTNNYYCILHIENSHSICCDSSQLQSIMLYCPNSHALYV